MQLGGSTQLEKLAILSPEAGRAKSFAAKVIDRRSSRPTALTLHFAPGMRPGVEAILRLAVRPAENTVFSVSHMPEPDEGWLEMLAMGLTFDLSGLMPFGPVLVDPPEHCFGIESALLDSQTETLQLVPGPHLGSSARMIPVLRVLAGLGAELSRLPGLRAVGWQSAASVMAPAYFMSAIRAWLVGGAFPALGLTSFSRRGDGGLESEGLTLFAGHELLLEPLGDETPQEAVKFFSRAIHLLVQSGASGLDGLVDSRGRAVKAELSSEEGVLRLWRRV